MNIIYTDKTRVNGIRSTMYNNSLDLKEVYIGGGLARGINTYIQNIISQYIKQYFCIESLEDNNSINFNKGWSSNLDGYYSNTYSYSYDLVSWTTVNNKPQSWTLNTGDKVYLRSNSTFWGRDNTETFTFSSTKNYNVSGNMLSLMYGDDFVGQTVLKETRNYGASGSPWRSGWGGMFRNSTQLISCENLIIPTINTGTNNTLSEGPCQLMFCGCSRMTKSPLLLDSILTKQCYNGMFLECSNLNQVVCLATNISANGCTSGWLRNVAGTGTFIKDANMSSWTLGESGIPSGWTVQNA